MPIRAVIIGLFALLSTPILAFDDLIRFSAVVAETSHGHHVFDYASPGGGFAGNGQAAAVMSDPALALALFAGSRSDELTGVDFSEITGVLRAGEPPQRLTILFGANGFADGAATALAARDFTQTVVEGYQTFARGDDYAVDLASASQPDPFGGSLGNAQRLALGGDFLVATTGWPELNASLAALHQPSLDGATWRALFEALQAASEENARLTLASGWLGQAFLAQTSKASGKTKSTGDGFTILFPMTTIAVTEGETVTSLQIALPYDDVQRAQLAADEISTRLVRHPFTPSSPRIELIDSAPLTVAVLSIDMPSSKAAAARQLYRQWMSDIGQGRFAPLDIRF